METICLSFVFLHTIDLHKSFDSQGVSKKISIKNFHSDQFVTLTLSALIFLCPVDLCFFVCCIICYSYLFE